MPGRYICFKLIYIREADILVAGYLRIIRGLESKWVYYNQDVNSVFEKLGISEAGLSSGEAEKRLKNMGKMHLKKRKKPLSQGSFFQSLKVY